MKLSEQMRIAGPYEAFGGKAIAVKGNVVLRWADAVEVLEAQRDELAGLLEEASRFNVLGETESAPAWTLNGDFEQKIQAALARVRRLDDRT